MRQAFVCLLTVVPLRAEDSHRSEMVSQLVFGETCIALEEREDFLKVKCSHDGYEGWVQKTQLTPVENIGKPIGYVKNWCTTATVFGVERRVPLFAPMYKSEILPMVQWADGIAIQSARPQTLTPTLLEQLCIPLLGTPYLWGGRSAFGIDCSGFVQQIFKLVGIALLRDASQQVTQGTAVIRSNATGGDLAFFNNSQGKIVHVGIVLDRDKIIHAAGQVRIDALNENGIWNEDLKKQTHVLHSVRRISDGHTLS